MISKRKIHKLKFFAFILVVMCFAILFSAVSYAETYPYDLRITSPSYASLSIEEGETGTVTFEVTGEGFDPGQNYITVESYNHDILYCSYSFFDYTYSIEGLAPTDMPEIVSFYVSDINSHERVSNIASLDVTVREASNPAGGDSRDFVIYAMVAMLALSACLMIVRKKQAI